MTAGKKAFEKTWQIPPLILVGIYLYARLVLLLTFQHDFQSLIIPLFDSEMENVEMRDSQPIITSTNTAGSPQQPVMQSRASTLTS